MKDLMENRGAEKAQIVSGEGECRARAAISACDSLENWSVAPIALQVQCEREVARLKGMGWTQANFAIALRNLLITGTRDHVNDAPTHTGGNCE